MTIFDLGEPPRDEPPRGTDVRVVNDDPASLQLLSRGVDLAGVMLIALDREGRVTLVNPRGCAVLGAAEPEILGAVWFETFLPEGSRAPAREVFARLLAGRLGLDEHVENPVLTAAGEERLIAWHNAVLRDAAGGVTGTISSGEDVTDHRRAEAGLRASEERYRRLFESAKDGILLLEAGSGRVLDVNASLLGLIDLPRGAVVGERLWELGPFQEIVGTQEAFEALTGDGDGQRDDLALVAADGRRVDVELVTTVYTVDHDRVVQCRVRDVSRRRQAERARATLEEQLRKAQRLEAIGQLAGGVAHDFNNLLTVITNCADLALEQLPEVDPIRADLVEIRKASQRAASLTAHLLAFSRKQLLQPKVLSLNAVVGGLVPMLRRLLGEDLDVATHLAPDLGNVRADPGQLELVLTNLAVNARDAMQGGGKLTIETANVTLDAGYAETHAEVIPGEYVALSVTDTGTGMDAATRARIFEPFFTTKEKGKGTGLGLATVYGTVRQSGGHLWVYSEPGQGSCFKIYLPRVDQAAPAEPGRPEAVDARGHETVLVVEDEGAVRRLAARILERAGYLVLTAASGKEALRLCQRGAARIQLLLTDVVMTGLNGRQLAERLAPLLPDLRVLYMSGYTHNAIAHHGVLEAGTRFLGKPFTAEALTRRVRETLDEPRASRRGPGPRGG